MSLPAGTVLVPSINSACAACHGGTHSLTKWSQKILNLTPLRVIHWRWEPGQLIVVTTGGVCVVQMPEFVAAIWHCYQYTRHAMGNILTSGLTVPLIDLGGVAASSFIHTCIDF